MKLGDKRTDRPVLILGQEVGNDGRSWDFQFRIKNGDTIIEEGVCRTLGMEDPYDIIDVDADDVVTNCKLSKNHDYLVVKGWKPDTTGLGPQK